MMTHRESASRRARLAVSGFDEFQRDAGWQRRRRVSPEIAGQKTGRPFADRDAHRAA
jgi:hypothetical protein